MMDLLLPYILSYLIDEVVPAGSMIQIVRWGMMMILCALLAWLTNIVANRMAARVAQLTTTAVRHDLFAKISALSCRQTDAFGIPSLEARLTTDTYNLHQMTGMMQRLGVRAPILLLGGIAVTLSLEPVLACVMIASLPLLGGMIYYISRKGVPLYAHLQKGVDDMVRTVRENITGIRVIKALSKTDYECSRFSDVNREVVAREKKGGDHHGADQPGHESRAQHRPYRSNCCGRMEGERGADSAGQNIGLYDLFYNHSECAALDQPHVYDVHEGVCLCGPYRGGVRRT